MADKITKFRITILLIITALFLILVYNQFTDNITNLLTGNVAITSNTLNEESANNNSKDFNKINLSLILIMIVALFIFVKYLKYNQKNYKT